MAEPEATPGIEKVKAPPLKAEYAALRRTMIQDRRARCLAADVPDSAILYGQCQAFTAALVAAFPQLRHVCGFYGDSEHHWAVEPDGSVVDLTWQQFGAEQDLDAYRQYKPDTDPVYLGRCVNCGAEIHGLMSLGRQCVCGPECELELQREMAS